MRSQASVDGRDEPGRQLVLRSANGDSRRERRHRIVADELVHDLRGAPQRLDVDAAVHPCAGERARESLPRDPVEGQRDRVDRAGNEVCSYSRGLERRRETAPGRALAIEAHRKAAAFGERCDQLVGPMRLERARGVVQEHSGRSEFGQFLRLLDERLRLSASAGAVDEARVELAVGGHDRLARLTEVLDIVQRILEPEDVDPALGRARDESAREVTAHRREPTRNRPRSAMPSGVLVLALSARIRSHGLSTPRRTAESKTPPPETSRYAKPAPSRHSASRSRSAVGMRPASGSWLSRRIVVSTRAGTARA